MQKAEHTHARTHNSTHEGMVLMNTKPEITCMIFLTGYQLFLFKGCRWFSGSFWPSWSTWTSCKFHHIITESASIATFVAVVTCVCFHQQGSIGQKGSKGSNVSLYSSAMPLVTRYFIHFLFNSLSFFFFFFVRVCKVRKETLD